MVETNFTSVGHDAHWNEVLSGHFSISFFSDLALMLWNDFLPKYVHFNGLKLHVKGTLNSFLSQYLGSKMQKSNFWRIKGVLRAFFGLKYRWFRTRLADWYGTISAVIDFIWPIISLEYWPLPQVTCWNLRHQLHRKVYKPLNKSLITNLLSSCHYFISYQKKI